MPKIYVTKRDQALVKRLHDYGLMTTRQIEETTFGNTSTRTALRRLRKLERLHLIKREEGLRGGPLVWQVTQKAAKLLGSENIYGHVNRNALEHEIAVSEVRMALEKAGAILTWHSGHKLKSDASKNKGETVDHDVVPDGIFVAKGLDGTTYPVFSLEVELWPKSQKRYRNTFYYYRRRQGLFKIWYLVKSQRVGEKLSGLWLKEASSYKTQLFSWSLIDEVVANPKEALIRTGDKSVPLSGLINFPAAMPPTPTTNGTRSQPKNGSVNATDLQKKPIAMAAKPNSEGDLPLGKESQPEKILEGPTGNFFEPKKLAHGSAHVVGNLRDDGNFVKTARTVEKTDESGVFQESENSKTNSDTDGGLRGYIASLNNPSGEITQLGGETMTKETID